MVRDTSHNMQKLDPLVNHPRKRERDAIAPSKCGTLFYALCPTAPKGEHLPSGILVYLFERHMTCLGVLTN